MVGRRRREERIEQQGLGRQELQALLFLSLSLSRQLGERSELGEPFDRQHARGAVAQLDVVVAAANRRQHLGELDRFAIEVDAAARVQTSRCRI
jgi:hypothetical protein